MFYGDFPFTGVGPAWMFFDVFPTTLISLTRGCVHFGT